MYGFILMAKGNTIEFYSQDEKYSEEWVEALKPSAILLDLKEAFDIKNLDKASIKKCRRNIVSKYLD